MEILNVSHLKKTFSRGESAVEALKGVSLTLHRGEFTCMMGPSGSGKSTLLHLVGALDRPTAGQVVVEGQKINEMSDEELSRFRRRRLGFVFQFFNLLPTLTAVENVALPLLLDGMKFEQVRAKALELLEQMGIGNRAGHRPAQLSGGEMQRVAIARALVADPVMILADEPTGNLDSKTGETVLELLRKLAVERDQTILMVTHDTHAASFGNRQIRMRDGLIESDIRDVSRGDSEKAESRTFPGSMPRVDQQ